MIRSESGKPFYSIVSMVDVSEQKTQQLLELNDNKQLETQIALLADEFRTLDMILKRLEDAEKLGLFGTFEFDIIKNNGWWSKNQFTLHGYEPQEVVPGYEVHLKCLHPEDREISENVFINILETDICQGSMDYRIIDNQQKLHYIHTEYSVERDAEGKPLRISGIDQDISERKLYEMQLLESQENYRLLSDTSQNIILSHDLSGVITYANDFCCSYFGIIRDVIVGLSVDSLLLENDRNERQEILNNSFLKGDFSLHKSEMEFFNAKGEKRILELLANPIIKNDQPAGVLIVANDVTERKADEMELVKHKDHLEELVKQRTEKLEEQKYELQRINKLFFGREFRIKELRDQVKELQSKLENKQG